MKLTQLLVVLVILGAGIGTELIVRFVATTLRPARKEPEEVVYPGLPDQDSVSVIDEGPLGPRAEHCGTVSETHAHPRCAFGLGAEVCQRVVIDGFASEAEVQMVRELADATMALGEAPVGGVRLVDMVHGIVTHGKHFASLPRILDRAASKPALAQQLVDAGIRRAHLDSYLALVERIQAVVRRQFRLPRDATLRMAKPAFISRIDSTDAATPNDEYWHVHVDTDQYGVFDITTLLYLTNHVSEDSGEESDAERIPFEGGTFDFVDAEQDDAVQDALGIAPAKGRLLMFTSGSEHPHRVSPVTGGVRYAMTTAFTCALRERNDPKGGPRATPTMDALWDILPQ